MNAVLDHQADTATETPNRVRIKLTLDDRKMGECRCSNCESLIPSGHVFIRILRESGPRIRQVTALCQICRTLHEAVQEWAGEWWIDSHKAVTPDFRISELDAPAKMIATLADENDGWALPGDFSGSGDVLDKLDNVLSIDTAIGQLNSQIHQLQQKRGTILGLTAEEVDSLLSTAETQKDQSSRYQRARKLVQDFLEALDLCADCAADSR